jgi:hypothetical protein
MGPSHLYALGQGIELESFGTSNKDRDEVPQLSVPAAARFWHHFGTMDAKFRRGTQWKDEHRSECDDTISGAGAWKTEHASTRGNTNWTTDMVFLNRRRGFESRRGFQFPVITPEIEGATEGRAAVNCTAARAATTEWDGSLPVITPQTLGRHSDEYGCSCYTNPLKCMPPRQTLPQAKSGGVTLMRG